jgi:hypothetical protein
MTEYAVALDKAAQFRAKKAEATQNFLELARLAKEIRESKCYKEVLDGTWSSFVIDREIGLGEAVSTVNSLIDGLESVINRLNVSDEEAIQIGTGRIILTKSTIKKLACEDYPKAKEILLSDGRMREIKQDLRELIPEQDRKHISEIEEYIRCLSKSWSLLNDIDVESIDVEAMKTINSYIDKTNGYLVGGAK